VSREGKPRQKGKVIDLSGSKHRIILYTHEDMTIDAPTQSPDVHVNFTKGGIPLIMIFQHFNLKRAYEFQHSSQIIQKKSYQTLVM